MDLTSPLTAKQRTLRGARSCLGWSRQWAARLVLFLRGVISRRIPASVRKEVRRQRAELAPENGVQAEQAGSGVVREFVSRHGRRPRMLHISNIANNAYNNAKLLRRIGFECDVICYDFYHMMSCPEWEDADFEDVVENQWFPDWGAMNMADFERPRWFVQGQMTTCLCYLLARHERRPVLSGLLWEHMAHQRRKLAHGEELDFIDLSFTMSLSQPLDLGRKGDHDFDARVAELVREFAERFPDRSDKLTAADLEPWRGSMPYWRKVFEYYDVIQGYGADPLVPMLADVPYFAFEHGTLRDFPFEDAGYNRATALGYALAEWVFVTNADCMEQAASLAGDRITFLNHPYDEDHGDAIGGFRKLRSELCDELDADFLFFFPTRHDWVSGAGNAMKGNDVFLHAFCTLRQQGFRVGMVACRWGEDLEDSRGILDAAGCSHHVRWADPLPISPFIRMCRACDVVVDQFLLGAFGGVFFKSMAAGVPVCSYLDEDAMLDRYGSCPPLMNCRTEGQIVQEVSHAIRNPAQLKALGEAGRAWIKQHHSARETVEKQLQAYRPILLLEADEARTRSGTAAPVDAP